MLVIMAQSPALLNLDDTGLLIALANTGHGTAEDPTAPDELQSAQTAQDWWSTLGGEPATVFGTDADVALLRAARALVRGVGLRTNGVDVALDAGVLAGLPLAFTVDPAPTLSPAGERSAARTLAARAAAALIRLPVGADAKRLKACPGPGCAWVFRDATRNGARRWCDMAACGNRAKAAAFRARGRQPDGQTVAR